MDRSKTAFALAATVYGWLFGATAAAGGRAVPNKSSLRHFASPASSEHELIEHLGEKNFQHLSAVLGTSRTYGRWLKEDAGEPVPGMHADWVLSLVHTLRTQPRDYDANIAKLRKILVGMRRHPEQKVEVSYPGGDDSTQFRTPEWEVTWVLGDRPLRVTLLSPQRGKNWFRYPAWNALILSDHLGAGNFRYLTKLLATPTDPHKDWLTSLIDTFGNYPKDYKANIQHLTTILEEMRQHPEQKVEVDNPGGDNGTLFRTPQWQVSWVWGDRPLQFKHLQRHP
jgi:hypothetical protein